MKRKLCCLACILAAAFAFWGCAADANGTSAVTPAAAENTVRESAAEPSAVLETKTEKSGDAEADSTAATGEMEIADPSAQPEEAKPLIYSERYEGDGYSFRYPEETEILTDTETLKSFLLPDGDCVLNITRINLSGQDITLDEALPVYEKTLEEQGNIVTESGSIEGLSYDNALLEVRLQEEGSAEMTDSVQAFFMADDYNYTFTVSSHKKDTGEMKEIVTRLAKSFRTENQE